MNGERRWGQTMLAALAALVLFTAPAPVRSQPLPAFIETVRAALVIASGMGALVGPDMVVTHAHGPAIESVGAEIRVMFAGYAEVTGRLSPAGRVPQDLIVPGVVFCRLVDADAMWIRLSAPAPAGVTPLKISRAFVSPVYVVRERSTHPGRYIGEQLGQNAVTGRVEIAPRIELRDGTTSVPGWSGAPVVNAHGELVGLISGSNFLNRLWPCPSRQR